MTVRNPNSSRFGKLLKLQYLTSPSTTLSSAAVDTYLLEKSRVTAVSAGERNYHIFYQLCSTSTLRKKYRLKESHHYFYLSQSDVVEVLPYLCSDIVIVLRLRVLMMREITNVLRRV